MESRVAAMRKPSSSMLSIVDRSGGPRERDAFGLDPFTLNGRVQEMRPNDPQLHFKFFRMSREIFDDLLHRVS